MLNTKHESNIINQKLEALKVKQKQIFNMPPEKVVEDILDAENPVALIHSFTDEDLYVMINDIGPADTLPIIARASNHQLMFILDKEIWVKDQIDIKKLTAWFEIIFLADKTRAVQFWTQENYNLLSLYLFTGIEVRIREHDEDPADFEGNFVTIDDVYYIRRKPISPDSTVDLKTNEKSGELLLQFLDFLARINYETYLELIIQCTAAIKAEMEEEIYHFRNQRMAEKGFLPFDEAIGIYQPIPIDDLKKKRISAHSLRSTDAMMVVPYLHMDLFFIENTFTRALSQIQDEDMLKGIQVEFVSLCNQIISVDQIQITSKKDLKGIVRKACGYLSMGLNRLKTKLGSEKRPNPSKEDLLLRDYFLADLFRLGFGKAMRLKWRADKWRRTSWYSENNFTLSFWDEYFTGVLGGLFLKKPLFFNEYKDGIVYREFESLEDIKKIEDALESIIHLDEILSATYFVHAFDTYQFMTYKNMLLTQWAKSFIEPNQMDKNVTPIPFEKFSSFFMELFAGKPDHSRNLPKTIPIMMRHNFLKWLARVSQKNETYISESIGDLLEMLFQELESEYGAVDFQMLDPKYVPHFIIAP